MTKLSLLQSASKFAEDTLDVKDGFDLTTKSTEAFAAQKLDPDDWAFWIGEVQKQRERFLRLREQPSELLKKQQAAEKAAKAKAKK